MNSAEMIHEASLALLAEPGIRLEHDGIYNKVLAAGGRPGAAAHVVRIPRELVQECLSRAPSSVQLADRSGTGKVLTPGANAAVWSVPGMNLCRHGQRRPFTTSDMADAARLIDQLPAADGVFGMSMDDVPPTSRDVVGLRIMAENTRKHIRVLCFTTDGAQKLCRMKSVFPGAWFSIGFTSHGPLRWTQLALETYACTAGYGIPVSINGEPMAGVSGPVTLAGSAAVGNAEILAGIVVNQLLEPGRPCIYNLGLAHIFDMRAAVAVTGGPENHILADISAQMGRFYNIPSCSWVSTESKRPDEQAALEKSIGYYSHIQSGVSLIWGIGQLESELTFSPAQAVIDNEIITYARRRLRGAEITPETLAVDVVREVGIAGDFLSHEHTLSHFRTEFFEPQILCRRRHDDWQQQGGRRLSDEAESRVDAILAAERNPCLADDQIAALRQLSC